jgi:hypothetical protein
MLFILALLMTVPQASARKVDACALLTPADIRAVLGENEPISNPKPNTQSSGGLLMHQCVFGVASSRSISLAVAGSATTGRARLTPREFWRRQFHPSERDSGAERDDHEREQENRARPIAGVGDEAFWSGNRIAGALYVLRGDTFIRLSVGGITNERERIEKSKALAVAALRRL